MRFDTASPLDFINYVVKKFPFRIKNIRTDRGHEFQSGRDLNGRLNQLHRMVPVRIGHDEDLAAQYVDRVGCLGRHVGSGLFLD